MEKDIFDSLVAGLEDAIAFFDGETDRCSVTVWDEESIRGYENKNPVNVEPQKVNP